MKKSDLIIHISNLYNVFVEKYKQISQLTRKVKQACDDCASDDFIQPTEGSRGHFAGRPGFTEHAAVVKGDFDLYRGIVDSL